MVSRPEHSITVGQQCKRDTLETPSGTDRRKEDRRKEGQVLFTSKIRTEKVRTSPVETLDPPPPPPRPKKHFSTIRHLALYILGFLTKSQCCFFIIKIMHSHQGEILNILRNIRVCHPPFKTADINTLAVFSSGFLNKWGSIWDFY